jgi:hypothetical protein
LDEKEKEGLKQIGDAVTERLVFQTRALYVKRLVQRRYVAPGKPEEGIKAKTLPLNVIPGSKYDFSIFSALLTCKFGYHLPTYRSQDVFAGCGWTPSRSTINELFNQSDRLFLPLFNQLEQMILRDSIVLGDDTRVQVLTRGALNDDQVAELEQRLKELLSIVVF